VVAREGHRERQTTSRRDYTQHTTHKEEKEEAGHIHSQNSMSIKLKILTRQAT
jgi:hypothetical protein